MTIGLTVSFIQRFRHGDRGGVDCCRIDRRLLAEALKGFKKDSNPIPASGRRG